MSWHEERRLNLAVEAEQRRKDADAAIERKVKARALASQQTRDERRAAAEERRRNRQQRRRDRRDRRRERAAAWAKNTTPGIVYRRGTLALVTASALAAVPAQVAHFAAISLMLLPLPFAVEGAAWVMAAGVAYADERRLPVWVRWLLRCLCLTAAGFAASINYQYGVAVGGPVVGWGLAAVSLLGPLAFEVRQWVATIDAATKGKPSRAERRKRKAEARGRRKHAAARRRDHADVCKLADSLMSAAPHGAMTEEEAFVQAWAYIHGTDLPGITLSVISSRIVAEQMVVEALADTDPHAPHRIAHRLRVALGQAADGTAPDGLAAPVSALTGGPRAIKLSQVASQMPPASRKGAERPAKGAGKAARKRTGSKPVPPRRVPGDTVPYHPLAKVAMADTGRRVTAVNGHHH